MKYFLDLCICYANNQTKMNSTNIPVSCVDTRTRNYYSVSQAALQEQQHDYGGDDEEDKTVQDYDMMAMMAVATALQEQQHDYGGDYGGDYGAQSKQYDPYTLSEQQITAGNSIIYNFFNWNTNGYVSRTNAKW